MSLLSVDLYHWSGWSIMGWFDKPQSCFGIGVVPSVVPINFLASKWGKSQQQNWIHGCFLVRVWPIVEQWTWNSEREKSLQ